MEKAKGRLFQNLRESRSLLMGIAIIGIAFYHAPFILHNQWVLLWKSALNWGVDLFLFLSGLGACHSIKQRGGMGYLRQRAARLLPGLYLFLLPWCVVMMALGAMGLRQCLGAVTLLGWWLGEPMQLNWYFSAVWMFFLLAIPCYRLFCRTKHPVGLWLVLVGVSIGIGILCPFPWLMTAVTRLPVFLTGMLFGRLEQLDFRHEGRLRGIVLLLLPAGLWLVIITYLGYGYVYGYSLGLWWYPYALVIPGGAVLISDLAAALRKRTVLSRLMRPIEWCGESSAEILMVHVGIYKIINTVTRFRNRYWAMICLGCLVLGCGYHYLVTARLSGRKLHRKTTGRGT